jgi:IstB-like ATP binding protein
MRSLKLGRMLDTLPERLALARQQSTPYADFLSLVFADEVERRDRTSADLRARGANLDPAMRLETFSSDSPVRYDKELWNELRSLRFLDDARGVLIPGPGGTV